MMDEYIDREFVEQLISGLPEDDYRGPIVKEIINNSLEDETRGFLVEQHVNGMPEDDASDVIAAYFLGYCRPLPGPFHVSLIYDKFSGGGRSYLKGSYDPNPTSLASFLYLGIVEVPVKFWDFLFQNGPRSLRCEEGTVYFN